MPFPPSAIARLVNSRLRLTGKEIGSHKEHVHEPRRAIASGIVMYLVMFVMIDSIGSSYNNLNMFYMALMMVAPIGVMMIFAMRSMFPSTILNAAFLVGSGLIFLGAFVVIRTQTTIGDTAFLRSMIPHHSGAILMCSQAKLSDPEIQQLCQEIIKSQRQEIEQMKRILERR